MYNGHADVTALIDGTGTVKASYYYDSWGNIVEKTGTVNNSITYSGYQYDSEDGLYYLNARMYDPKIARFMQEDTYRGQANDPLSLNIYTYCSNNPIMYADPTGHVAGSVVDYMNSQGMNSSYSARKVEAAKLGITNYTGTAAQNTLMLQKLQTPAPTPKPTPAPVVVKKTEPVVPQKKATESVNSNSSTSTTGTVTVNGQAYNIYVPQVSNGTNSSINGGGWTTVQTIKGSDKDFDFVGAVVQSVGNLGDNTQNTVAENSHNEIQNNEIIRKNGSDKGTLNLGVSNERLTGVGGLVIDTVVGAAKSIGDNTNTTNFQVVIQQNGNQQRAVIEVGNPKSKLSTSGEYYLLPKGATGIEGLQVGALENALDDAGYGKYTASGFLGETNIKATISESHDTNPYTGYIGFDSKGNMTFTPIVYKDDKVQIVTYNNFDGFTWGEKTTYTFNNNSQGGALPVAGKYNNLISGALGTKGVTISK